MRGSTRVHTQKDARMHAHHRQTTANLCETEDINGGADKGQITDRHRYRY